MARSAIRGRKWLVLALTGLASTVEAEQLPRGSGTGELGVAVHHMSVADNSIFKSRTYAPTITATLSHAMTPIIAFASSIGLEGRDLLLGSMAIRWYPLANARETVEHYGAIETGTSSMFRLYTSVHGDVGRVRSPVDFDTLQALEAVATFYGVGLAFGMRLDLNNAVGFGLEVGLSRWLDTPSSSLVLRSTTSSACASVHVNL